MVWLDKYIVFTLLDRLSKPYSIDLEKNTIKGVCLLRKLKLHPLQCLGLLISCRSPRRRSALKLCSSFAQSLCCLIVLVSEITIPSSFLVYARNSKSIKSHIKPPLIESHQPNTHPPTHNPQLLLSVQRNFRLKFNILLDRSGRLSGS